MSDRPVSEIHRSHMMVRFNILRACEKCQACVCCCLERLETGCKVTDDVFMKGRKRG